MTNLPFGIAFLVLAILSVILPFFFDDEKQGISVSENENGDFMF